MHPANHNSQRPKDPIRAATSLGKYRETVVRDQGHFE